MQKTTTSIKLRLFFGKMLPFLILLAVSVGKSSAQPYNNGNLSTGATSSNGVAAPAGYTWSEVQAGNVNAGFGANITANISMADDFTVPAGVGWNISKLTFWAYSTGFAGATSPFTDVRVRIFNTDPSVGTPVPVYGDFTTNRFSASSDALMYRIFNATTGTTRKIWKVEANVATTLGPGHYWIEWALGNGGLSNFSPSRTVVGTVTQAGNNAKQHDIGAGTWVNLVDGANAQDMPFQVDYTIVGAPACTPITGAVLSRQAVINENFNTAIPLPAGWVMKNQSNPVGPFDWRQGPYAAAGIVAHSGPANSYIASTWSCTTTTGVGTLSNWLFTPNITLNNGDKFSFWTRTLDGTFPDKLEVRMSTNGASTDIGATELTVGDFSTLLLEINPTLSGAGYPLTWTQYTITISGMPAAGVSGRLAFRHAVPNAGGAGANSEIVAIDDVLYSSTAPQTICSGSPGSIKVDITGGVGPYTVVYNAAPGGNTTVSGYTSGANINVSPVVNTVYTLVSVTGADGCVSTNNSGSATINVVFGSTAAVLSQVQVAGPPTNLINEGFTVAPPASWVTQNNSQPNGTTSWFQGNPAVFPANSGATNSYLGVNFNSTTGTNTISNWAFPPSVLMKNGDKFSFYTRTTTGQFPDRLQVRLNTTNTGTNVGATNTSVGDYSTLLLDINPTYTATGYPTAWTQFTITMSGLPAAGVSGRLAFRYFVESGGPAGANSDYIGIDDVVYTTFPLVNPTTCTGSTANLKVDITGGTGPFKVVIQPTPPGTPASQITVNNYNSGDYIPVTPPVTTTYSLVSVTSAIGCLGTGNSGTPTVTVSPTTQAAISIIDNPTGPLCAGNPKLLTVTGGASTQSFTAAGAITINDVAPATPYPATLVVSGLPTSGVTVKSVTINGISHTFPDDIDMLLQSPTNTNVVLISDVGGSVDWVNANITLQDGSPALADNTFNPSGTYAPTNFVTPDTWVAPGPGSVTQAAPALSMFTGDMNGTWKLFIVDDLGGDIGTISGGYTITFNVPSTAPVGYTWLWSPAAGLSSTTTNPVAASPMQTTTYTVMGTAPSGCQTTAQITVVVNQLPAVVTQPTNTSVCAGTTATFTATGTGAGATYQWQVSPTGAGGPWSNLANAAPYSGVTTTTLTIAPTTQAMNGYAYRLVVSGTCPPSANSNAAILTIIPLPTVTITPAGPICGGVPGTNGVLLSLGALPPVPGSVTANSGTINLPVPDNSAAGANTNLSIAGIPANATITNVSVTWTMSHTYPGDMIFNLKAPNGQILNLYKYGGGLYTGAASGPTTWGWYGAKVSQAGTVAYSTVATAPFIYNNSTAWKADALNANVPGQAIQNPTGFVSAAPNFQALYTTATSANGTWTLAMADGGAGDVGSLASWIITVDYTTPAAAVVTYTWSPAAGLYTDANATVPYIAGTQAGSVYAAPTVNTVYTVTATNSTTGCVGTGSVTVNYTPPAPVVSPNPGAVCVGGAAVALTITSSLAPTTVTLTNSTPVAVPDNTANGVQSVINVAGVPAGAVISVMSVTLNMPHTYPADMIFNLKAPNGQILNLYKHNTNTDNGAASIPTAGFFNAVVNSSSAVQFVAVPTPYQYGITAPAGPYKPDALNGVANPGYTIMDPTGFVSNAANFGSLYSTPNGAWTLAMADGGPGDVGTLQSWTLSFTYGTPSVGIWNYNSPGSGNYFGLFTDANATVAYTGTPVQTVYAKPSPAGTYNYYVTVSTGTCTSPARLVPVNVYDSVKIITQPVSTSVCTDKSTTFTVVAVGSNLTYQWQVSTDNGTTFNPVTNGGVYSGATTNTLTITNPPVSMNGYIYRVLINGSSPCGSKTSAPNVLLSVYPLPTVVITASPYTALFPGLITTLSSTVSPVAAATYTWLRNGVAVPGATAATLNVDVDGLGDYQLRVTDIHGCTNSSNVLTIRDSATGTLFIYPNPNSGRFQVRYYSVPGNVLPRGLTVYDAKGSRVLVLNFTITAPYARMDVDLRPLGKGVYWIELGDFNGHRLAVGRAVVQ